MIMRKATCRAKDGTEFTFEYDEKNRMIVVYIFDRVHMTIVDVAPEDSMKEMNDFMDIWNEANPN